MKEVDAWDTAYRAGRWDYLADQEEGPRYRALASYAVRGSAHVLDLGCGVGLLRAHLPESTVLSYTGVDFSASAIERARAQNARRSEFVVASIDEWEPTRPYDVIVFNEVLYYLSKPVATLRRYRRFLTSSGIVLVSMYRPRPLGRPLEWFRIAIIWARLRRDWLALANVVVRSGEGRSWRLQALRPRLGERSGRSPRGRLPEATVRGTGRLLRSVVR